MNNKRNGPVIFIKITKAASSSIIDAFVRAGYRLHWRCNNAKYTNKDIIIAYSVDQMRRNIPADVIERAFVFSIVRDPYARAASAYGYLGLKGPLWECLDRKKVDPPFDTLGVKSEERKIYHHLCVPQSEVLTDLKYLDRVYNFNNLLACTEDLSDTLGVHIKLLHSNKTKKDYDLTDPDRVAIRRYMAKDFVLLDKIKQNPSPDASEDFGDLGQ